MDEETSDLQTLVQQAREGDQQALGHLLDNHRDFLVRLANQQIGEKLRARVDGSDVVQMTFLQAFRAFEDFQGTEHGEFVAWLKQILSRNVSVAVRDHAVLQKRALNKERRLDNSRNSGPALRQALFAKLSTPSAKAIPAARHDILDFLREFSPCCLSQHSGVFCASCRHLRSTAVESGTS